MELAGEDGSKVILGPESMTEFGRSSGFTSNDRTVSRRHLLLKPKTSENSNGASAEPRLSFEVIGKNPIWIRSGSNEQIRTFRRPEKGEMAPGDSFCVGGKQFTWFKLKTVAQFEEEQQEISAGESEIAESSGRCFDSEDIDVSAIDPVKEFGFLVRGHEFDCYGDRLIRNVKKWDWFLEEPRKNSDEDEEDYGRREKRGGKRKRKKGTKSDDEDWTDESEDAVELAAKTSKVQKTKYSTRSKNGKKFRNETGGRQKKTANSNRDYEEDEDDETLDEDDETLGGFIVDDEEDNEEQIVDEDEEEEEEELILDEDEED